MQMSSDSDEASPSSAKSVQEISSQQDIEQISLTCSSSEEVIDVTDQTFKPNQNLKSFKQQ